MTRSHYTIAVLAGDGIGPEVMVEARRVLARIGERFGHDFELQDAAVGGAAYELFNSHFPAETQKICAASDAILFGSVGGPIDQAELPKWRDCEANSILALRKAFSFNANFRPAKVYPELRAICPLKDAIVAQTVDLLVVRELLGDIYFGEHTSLTNGGARIGRDVAEYTDLQVSAIAHVAFRAAQLRRRKVTSVDKANVLESSKLWRTVVRETAAGYPDVQLENMLVDNCAMQLIRNPSQFDVILAPNLFGDILSDAAAVLPGSLGMTPSASLNATGFGLYEPSGGSAPDLAGKGIANPCAQILSVAMMLRYSFNRIEESNAVEAAIERALASGARTRDIAGPGEVPLGTSAFTDRVLGFI